MIQSIDREYKTVTPWVLGDRAARLPRSRPKFAWPQRQSKFWVQITTHGRLAIGARGEGRMGICVRICFDAQDDDGQGRGDSRSMA
jgi:hypothetical protein